MSKTWQLQEAKAKLSEVVDKAVRSGPQYITRHGKNTAVVISVAEYRKLRNRNESLVEFFQRSPLRGLHIERSKDIPRNVEL